ETQAVSEHSLCRQYARDAFGNSGCRGKGSGSRLEDGFHNVVLIGSVEEFDVKVAADLAGKRTPEVLDELDIKLPDSVAHFWHAINGECAAAQVDYRSNKRFVHWNVCRSEADDA